MSFQQKYESDLKFVFDVFQHTKNSLTEVCCVKWAHLF